MDSAAVRPHYESHDMSRDFPARPHPLIELRSPSPTLIAEANARVSQWMRTVGRKNKFREQMSRSVNNLTDLKEEEDEEETARRWVWSGGVAYRDIEIISTVLAEFFLRHNVVLWCTELLPHCRVQLYFNPFPTAEVGRRCENFRLILTSTHRTMRLPVMMSSKT